MLVPGEHGEDRRADQVERQVDPRVRPHPLELDRGEGGEDQQRADDLDELVHAPSLGHRRSTFVTHRHYKGRTPWREIRSGR